MDCGLEHLSVIDDIVTAVVWFDNSAVCLMKFVLNYDGVFVWFCGANSCRFWIEFRWSSLAVSEYCMTTAELFAFLWCGVMELS